MTKKLKNYNNKISLGKRQNNFYLINIKMEINRNRKLVSVIVKIVSDALSNNLLDIFNQKFVFQRNHKSPSKNQIILSNFFGNCYFCRSVPPVSENERNLLK
jgi:hypothetical protein